MRFQQADPAGTGDLVDVDGDVPAGTPVYVHGPNCRFIIEQDPMTGNVTLDWQWGTIIVMRPHGDGAKLVHTPRPEPIPVRPFTNAEYDAGRTAGDNL